jgi:hypothetical protein
MSRRFSREELVRFADIFEGAGHVFLGSSVISPLLINMSGIARTVIIVIGFVFTLACYFASWFITRKIKKWKRILS